MVPRNVCSLVIAAAVWAIAPTGAGVAQEQWQTVTSPDGSFTVEMPGKPSYFREELKTAKGTPFTLHQYVVEQGQGKVTYIVQGATYPDDSGILQPKSFLEELFKRDAKKLNGGEWSSIKWGTRQGATTLEGLGVEGETDRRCFSAVKAKDDYDLLYWGPLGTATSPAADRFFNSLLIAARPGLPVPSATLGREPNHSSRDTP